MNGISALRAIVYSSVSLYANQILGLFFTMYIARVFTPEQLGAYGIAASITILSSELRTLGSGEFLIREKELTPEIIQNSLGLTIILSWGLGIFLMFFSASIGSFYNEPIISTMIALLTINFFTSPFISINASLLSRNMQFDKVIALDWISFIVTSSFSILLIHFGYGIFSLVYASIIGSTIQLLSIKYFKAPNMAWLPLFRNMRAQRKFGIVVSLSSLLEKSCIYSIDLLAGRLGSIREAGVISKSVSSVELSSHMLLSGTSPIIQPLLSRKKNNEVLMSYFKATSFSTSVSSPAIISMIPASELIISLLFGDQWEECSIYLKYLAIWCIFRNLHPFSRQLFITLKQESQFIKLQVLQFFVSIIAIFWGYSIGGLEQVCTLLIFASLISYMYTTVKIYSASQLKFIEVITACHKHTLALSIFCYTTSELSFIVASKFGNHPVLTLFYFAVLMIFSWLFAIRATNHPLWDELKKIISPYAFRIQDRQK